MKISPLAKLGMLGTFAAGTALSAVLIGSAHHTAAPTQITVRQDAATAAVTTSAAPVKHAVAPKPAASTSTAVNQQQQAAVQEAPVVTDQTSSAPAPGDTSTAPQPAASYPPPKGNPVGSTEYNPYVSPSPSEAHS